MSIFNKILMNLIILFILKKKYKDNNSFSL